MFHFVYADEDGNGYIDEDYFGLGLLGASFVEPSEEEVIPLPEGASLTMIPNRAPVVINDEDQFVLYPGAGWVMGALLPQGYTRTLLPAFVNHEGADGLPLFGYSAVFAQDGELYVAAVPTDEDYKWNPQYFNTDDLAERVEAMQNRFPENRLLKQLGHCALEYGCFTAQNIFYHRWEGGIPVSPVCNARCLGCISLQPSECCPSPQSRLTFVPTVQEVVELAVYHLQDAEDGIISFGQGCEGEPSLAAVNISQGIRLIRQQTDKGQININTNAGYTEGIRQIVDAGLDTMRVSIISALPESYAAYYRSSYQLENVKESIRYALDKGIYVSLNMLYFPGFNDRAQELAGWLEFFRELPVQMIQVRNLNIDPDAFLEIMPEAQGEILGTRAFLAKLHQEFPDMVIGSFSHYVEE